MIGVQEKSSKHSPLSLHPCTYLGFLEVLPGIQLVVGTEFKFLSQKYTVVTYFIALLFLFTLPESMTSLLRPGDKELLLSRQKLVCLQLIETPKETEIIKWLILLM